MASRSPGRCNVCLFFILDRKVTDKFSGDPLAVNRYDLLSLTIQTSFERSFTVLFGPNILFYKVSEGPGTYFGYAQKIVPRTEPGLRGNRGR